MLSFLNSQIHFDYDRCCQCGTCLAACPIGALSPQKLDNGCHIIFCDGTRCTSCRVCINVCPAPDLPQNLLTEEGFASLKSLWLGHSTDKNVRYNSSSGGVARTLLADALCSGFVELGYSVIKSLIPSGCEGAYLNADDDVLNKLSNSVYEPLLVNKSLQRKPGAKKLLVIGTNCQLLAMEKFYKGANVELFKIGIFCKQQKNGRFANFIRKRLSLPADTYLNFRGDGWPGRVSGQDRSLAWEDAAGLPFGKRLWRIPGCKFCGHPFGVNADITLADPWGIISEEMASGGETLVLVRTQRGCDMLKSLSSHLILKETSVADVMKSVDWNSIKKQQDQIVWRCGGPTSYCLRMVYRFGDWQCQLYEKILEKVTLPRLVLKIMNRLPYCG